ncbi:hypothetical protein F5Y10DRAFT_279745 [Nemania abortiva]|nr:hypothetical protein F5Y10DRAFT_279745 [Nemania abortiva]
MDTIIKKIIPFEDPEEWKGQCVVRIRETLEVDQSTDLLDSFVNRAGRILPNPLATPNLVAGINYNACVKYCGYDKLSTVFSFEIFSAGATNYLLPWLALTAQLPFETGENGVLANVMSFSYAVGSPMLITYSLATTILNQHWLREKFRKLEAPDRPLHPTSRNVRIFLQESQQLPLRLSHEDGDLASLIVLSDNVDWWEKLKTSILLTRRGVTLSLVAQILVAVLSWILTIILAFETALGNASAALALAAGTLWVWLVPLIFGWIVVGTQMQYGTIDRALKRDMINISDDRPSGHSGPDGSHDGMHHNAVNDMLVDAPDLPVPFVQANVPRQVDSGTANSGPIMPHNSSPQQVGAVRIIGKRQKAFRVAHEQKLMRPLTRSPSEGSSFRLEPPSSDFDIPNCLGLSVAGDEKQEGPAFNYARIFTWWNMANRLYQALKKTDDNLDGKLDLDLEPVSRELRFGQDTLKGDALVLSRYCGLAHDNARSGNSQIEPEEINEYPRWSQLDSEFYQRMIIAMAIAVYVQWGSTSAGLIIAYLTEVTGLGCRAGGYLLYGVLATLAFFFLFISSIISHAAMLRHEVLQAGGVRNGNVNSQKLALRHHILRFCAVLTRMLGRTLAVANAIWIILSSLWELVGFYDNCWCDTVYLSKGPRGWVLLFVDANDMAHAAVAPWAGGIFLSVFVGATSCGVFWLYCRGNRA